MNGGDGEAFRKPDKMTLPARVHEDLRQQIVSGMFAPGARLPTEQRLCVQYGVSRVTVREALRMLQRDHLIESVQGRGHFVLGTPGFIKKSVNDLQSVSELMHDLGRDFRTEVVRMRREPAGDLAGDLDVAPESRVVRLERLWRAPDEPVIYSIDIFPEWIAGDGQTAWEGSLLETLERAGAPIAYSHALIKAATLPPAIAKRIGLPPSLPWVLMDQVNFTATDQPVLRSFDYHRGDEFEFYTLRHRRLR
jgi:GntR family transcriptional regulator